jgi:hypothetical protein
VPRCWAERDRRTARGGQRWEGAGGLLEQYRPVVIEKLKRFGMQDLEQHIVLERHLSPASIERLYNAEGGAIYGLASHGKLHGGFKPRNRSRVVRNLYLAGGSSNPGPGVPMVLNTSFNENEPVVCRPHEALDCFLRTKMDVLVLGDCMIVRDQNSVTLA